MKKIIKPAYLFLLTHPDNPGFIKIKLVYSTRDEYHEENVSNEWIVHRYADVEEGPLLAESIIWDLMGVTKSTLNEQVEIDVSIAEYAFRQLIYQLREKIALVEKERENPNSCI